MLLSRPADDGPCVDVLSIAFIWALTATDPLDTAPSANEPGTLRDWLK